MVTGAQKARNGNQQMKQAPGRVAVRGNGKHRQEQINGDPATRLDSLLRQHQEERHVIVIHAFPDPDAISSAFAHRLISAQYGITADIIYTGTISHRQNVALVKLLDIVITPYDATMDLGQYDAAVFVDNQATTSVDVAEALKVAPVPVLAVVDHHELQQDLKPAFIDLRQIGATATIYTQYLEHGLVKLDKSQHDHVIAATALMHGIMSDTGGFVRAGEEDFQAAGYLSHFADTDLLDQIMSQSRPRQTMDIIHQALGSRVVAENFSIAGVGYLREGDRDTIAQTSAFLLTEENVHTALVYGIMLSDDGREKLVCSLRTSRPIHNADEFIKEVFGKDEAGRYYGGGKRDAGGFEIPVGFLSGDGRDEYRQMKWKVYDAQVKQRMFAHMGVERPGNEGQSVIATTVNR
jgi:nanoRNase/pAp phosphatase (c-di-AMP/oligoRNAs hydrolase)